MCWFGTKGWGTWNAQSSASGQWHVLSSWGFAFRRCCFQAMIMAITSNLISSSPISFVQPNNVIALLHGARDRLLPNQRLSVSVEEELQAVALTITRASRMLTQIDADHDSLDFLNHLIAFSQVVFTSVAADAGRLGAASQGMPRFGGRPACPSWPRTVPQGVLLRVSCSLLGTRPQRIQGVILMPAMMALKSERAGNRACSQH